VRDAIALEPRISTAELLRRARLAGYDGGKSAFYAMVSSVRPRDGADLRGPGQISEHELVHADVAFVGGRRRVRIFASRLRWSRHVEVAILGDERAASIGGALVAHFRAMGGVPLLAIFHGARGVAREGARGIEWDPSFACLAVTIGVGVEVCERRGRTDRPAQWIRAFLARGFADEAELAAELAAWARAANDRVEARFAEERARLRQLRIAVPNVEGRV